MEVLRSADLAEVYISMDTEHTGVWPAARIGVAPRFTMVPVLERTCHEVHHGLELLF